jgi:hypothetical protein
VVEKSDQTRRRISLELSAELLAWIDGFKAEWGLRSRGDILERVLEQLVHGSSDEEDGHSDQDLTGGLNETGAIVLINRALVPIRDQEQDLDDLAEIGLGRSARAKGAGVKARPAGGGGIDLPGFVRRQSAQLKRSLEPSSPGPSQTLQGVELIDSPSIEEALTAARDHWLDLYGQPATEAVLEAAKALASS